MTLTLQIILIIFLIILNGIFSASEMSLVSVNSALVEADANKGKRTAKRVLKLIDNPTKFLSAIQIGITIFGLLNGALVANAFTDTIVSWFKPIHANIVRTISLVVITLILAYFQVVFGGLVPKRIAMKYPKQVAYFTSGPLFVISIIMRPFVFLLTKSANLFTKPLGIKDENDKQNMTEEEIRLLVSTSSDKGILDEEEGKMIENILDFESTEVSQIMTHRTEMSAINIKWNKKQIFDYVNSEKYTRFPVYENSIDHIVGILNAKELLLYLDKPAESFSIKNLARKPLYVPETKKTRELFQEMQKEKNHIPIIIDEYGGTSGLVTLEDLIEEILGNIFDEYDEVEEDIEIISKDEFIIDGLANIDDIERELEIGLPIEDYDTVSGFIIGIIGKIPEENEHVSFNYGKYNFTVSTYTNSVIDKVKIKRLKEDEVESEREE